MSNLSHQFDGQAKAIEEQQRRRFARKHETGFVGNGFWYWNYPNMVGTIGSGEITRTQPEDKENPVESLETMGHGAEGAEGSVGTSTGMGEGGTAFGAAGSGQA